MDETLEFKQELMMFLNCNSAKEKKATLTQQQIIFAQSLFKQLDREVEVTEIETLPISKKIKCILKKKFI